jgi:hypothetical protein
LATLFQGGEPVPTAAVATAAYVPPKQPKKGIFHKKKEHHVISFSFFFIKDSQPRVMIASVVQAFSL